jgi:hypothetical protein
MRRLAIAFLLLGGVLLPVGCAVEAPEGTDEDAVSSEDSLKQQVCPMLMIKCAEGYKAKQLPNCNQICVPDQGFECSADEDCPAIYCITTPCPQLECAGHQCVTSKVKPEPGPACGDIHCNSQQYCCNDSCGICAPFGAACIQIACDSTI